MTLPSHAGTLIRTKLNRFCSISPARLRWGLNLIGVVTLVAGFAVAGAVLRAEGRLEAAVNERPANPAAPLATSDSRKQSRQLEIYYGKSGLLFERWSERLQNLAHGKTLADAIVVVASLTAVGCFFVAARLPV